jgi:pimeloyl-ACP methyl ester carboxylesterase
MHVAETTEKLATKAAAIIPKCELELISHCGHFVQIEASEKVNQRILKFLAEPMN